MSNPVRAILVLLAAAVLTITGCGPPQGEDIPFETIVKEVGGGPNSIQIERPLLKVATNAEEMAELKTLTDQRGHHTGTGIEWSFDKRLDEVDFSTYLVIAALQGRKPSGGYKIEIVSVKPSGYQVYVITDFITPTPGMPVTTIVRSPYHVIKVKKADLVRRGKLTFVLMNTSQQAQVNITYYNDSGGTVTSQTGVTIPVNGTIQRNQDTITQLLPNKMYSAKIESTNGQPLAVVVEQRNHASPTSSTSSMAYNGFSRGEDESLTPALFNNYYGWASSLTVQNLESWSTSIRVTYYTNSGSVSDGPYNLPGKASKVFYQPANPLLPSGNQDGLFAARVTSDYGDDMAVVVNASSGKLSMSYNGFLGGSGLSWQPLVEKNYQGWTSSVTAQNLGAWTDITLTYDSGIQETRSAVQPYHHALFYQGNSQITDGAHWAKVEAEVVGGDVVAVVTASGSGTDKDLAWSYNGFNR